MSARRRSSMRCARTAQTSARSGCIISRSAASPRRRAMRRCRPHDSQLQAKPCYDPTKFKSGLHPPGEFGEEKMQRNKPPFRADHVGSFLRPAPLKDARARREKGEITAAQLKEVEDREIEKVIRKQEE